MKSILQTWILLFQTWYWGADAQTISEGTLTIGGYVNQATVQFITGELDVDKDWDTYIEKLNNMGVENYLATWQNYYDAYENK